MQPIVKILKGENINLHFLKIVSLLDKELKFSKLRVDRDFYFI